MDDAIERAIEISKLQRRLPAPPSRRLIRERVGVTQEHVGQALGVDRATVSRWETGDRDPRGARLADYVRLLDRLTREAMKK